MAAAKTSSRRLGYVFEELCMWHSPGELKSVKNFIEPVRHWEDVATKRRLHNLLAVSGLLEQLVPIKARPAAIQELARVHDMSYINSIKSMSDDDTKGHYPAGEGATFSPGGFEVACMSAGAGLVALEAVLQGKVQAAYALTRPPGHHAEKDEGRGFCVFNNIAVAAAAALEAHGLQRVAIVDFDVHHGNGTQHIFESDPRVLFISLHQANNYPPKSGYVTEQGVGPGEGYTINVPLPPGSGSGAYKACYERLVRPALDAFQPQLVLVSAGYDANYTDPLAAMCLSSEDFRWMAAQLQAAADKLCGGKLVAFHEGGYSDLYVPFCGLAFIEQLSGVRTHVEDPYLYEVSGWEYQELQVHQDAVINRASQVLELLQSKCKQ